MLPTQGLIYRFGRTEFPTFHVVGQLSPGLVELPGRGQGRLPPRQHGAVLLVREVEGVQTRAEVHPVAVRLPGLVLEVRPNLEGVKVLAPHHHDAQ